MKNKVYLAVDLGASSGRVMAGVYNGKKLVLDEVSRFAGYGMTLPTGLHWNVTGIFNEIKNGIRLAVSKYGKSIVSIGVDTWGVDYGLLDKKGRLLGIPFQYRDSRNDGMEAKLFKRISKDHLSNATGIQLMPFNTLFQLYSEVVGGSAALAAADKLLFMPDILHYWLSGVMVNELSIASTSQMMDVRSNRWASDIVKKAGIPDKLLGRIVMPGADIGPLRKEICEDTGAGNNIRVIVPASHDTASAVVSAPISSKDSAYLSSGTWSLMGIESARCLVSPQSLSYGFTNERGFGGCYRILKNISGLWILQESKRVWEKKGVTISYSEIGKLAGNAKGMDSVVDVNDPVFLKPGDMPARIREYCRQTGQKVPKDIGQVARVIFNSLAEKYRQVWNELKSVTGKEYKTLAIVGGGCREEFLNQLTADSLGCEVTAGPVEATALGNVVVQMIGAGDLKSQDEGRALIGKSFSVKRYTPKR